MLELPIMMQSLTVEGYSSPLNSLASDWLLFAAGEEVVTINPGRLAKGNGGGTYARISVLDVDGSDKAFSSRCRVDIVRV